MLWISYERWEQSVNTETSYCIKVWGCMDRQWMDVAPLSTIDERHLNPNLNLSHNRIPIRVWRLGLYLRVLQWAEIKTLNEGMNPLGKTAVGNYEEDYKHDAKDKDANNTNESSKVKEFDQEAN